MSQFPSGSKSAWAGNHNPTGPELRPLNFTHVGLPLDRAELATFRVPGGGSGGQYLAGYIIRAQVPGGNITLPWSATLVNGDNIVVPNSTLTISGLSLGAELRLPRPLALPPGSLWKLVARVPANLTREQLQQLPETLTVTFLLQESPGPGIPPLPAGAPAYAGTGIGYARTDLTNRVT